MNTNKPTHDSPRMSALIDEYHEKATREGFIDLGDAGDALAATQDYQLKGWLRDFILRWETAEAIDEGYFGDDGSDASEMAAALIEILKQPRNADPYVFHMYARNVLRKVVRR